MHSLYSTHSDLNNDEIMDHSLFRNYVSCYHIAHGGGSVVYFFI
jgi:hypothetical protein